MARHAVDESGTLIRQASDYLYGFLDLLPQLSALQRVLPPETLAWRLELLRQGCAYVEPRVASVKQRCLAVAGERDILIPSAEEAARLAKKMQRCRACVLPGRSHALLQEAGVNLVQILQVGGAGGGGRVVWCIWGAWLRVCRGGAIAGLWVRGCYACGPGT
jgi:pimeloyl-ACP methyl ester carboxylesterase